MIGTARVFSCALCIKTLSEGAAVVKCRFDYTRKYEFLIRIFIYLLPVSPFVIMTFSFQETSVKALQILIWVIFAFLIGIVLAVSAARSGVIRAESDKLSVSHFF